MDYIKKAKEEIRNDWFANHKAEVEDFGSGKVIYFKEPGHFMYGAKIILHDNNIFISGDIGEAVYNLTCEATLENIKDFDLHYLHGKLVAMSEEKWDFDPTLAKEELDEDYEGREKDKVYQSIVSGFEDYGQSLESFRAWLLVVYETTGADSDMMEDCWDLGKVIPRRAIAYWVALQMIAEITLKKEKVS